MQLYSIKMRGSKNDNHISGAESIVKEENLDNAVSLLMKRALNHSKGKSDFINIKVEKIDNNDLIYIEPLKVITKESKTVEKGLNIMLKELLCMNIKHENCIKIIEMFKNIENMSGAILLDVNTLERLEYNKSKGIRVTYMDFEESKIERLNKKSLSNDKNKSLLDNTHFIEALCLSSKVCNAPNIIGEICCSDDINYTTGYVASKNGGYIRINNLKKKGEIKGGRIFLYDPALNKTYKIQDTINYLENAKVIVKNDIVFE